jgi:serine/threonine-protein kinase RsbW
MKKQVSVQLRNTLSELDRLRQLVTEFGERHHLPPKVLFALNLALEEVVTNVIFYAYEDEAEHHIFIRLSIWKGEVVAEVEDDGRPFNPLEVPRPDLESPLEERPIGGLGLHLVRNLMDEVQYRRHNDRNLFLIRKSVAGA